MDGGGGNMLGIFVSIFVLAFLLFSQVAHGKSYSSSLCNNPDYICYTAKRGDTWKILFPDEAQRTTVMKINRVNISLHSGMKIAIPKNLDTANYLDFSPFPRQIDPPGKKMISVSLSKLAFGAYDSNGSLEYWGPVSGGQGYCSDIGRRCRTATGKFAIYQKGGAGCKSTRYPVGRGGAPMSYCMFFNGNFALHGSPIVPGYNASHGCVRLFTNDARWLNQEFTAGENSVAVVVNE
jgi:hypothetical protein